jgi:hypothetical protein
VLRRVELGDDAVVGDVEARALPRLERRLGDGLRGRRGGGGVGLACAGVAAPLRVRGARPRSCADSANVPARASDTSSKSVLIKILFIFRLPAEKTIRRYGLF